MIVKETIVAIAIHAEGSSPIFGERVITVSLADNAGGCFIALSQENDAGEEQRIEIEPEELPVIMRVANRLLKQEGAQ